MAERCFSAMSACTRWILTAILYCLMLQPACGEWVTTQPSSSVGDNSNTTTTAALKNSTSSAWGVLVATDAKSNESSVKQVLNSKKLAVGQTTEPPTTSASTPPPALHDLTSHEQKIIGVFQQASPSVVSIQSLFFHTKQIFWGISSQELRGSIGSGFFWDDQHIVTNHHVIYGDDDDNVRLPDTPNFVKVAIADSLMDTIVIGSDSEADIAVLQLTNVSFPLPKPLEKASDVHIGQTVLSIGVKDGDKMFTSGIVSRVDEDVKTYHSTKSDKLWRNQYVYTDATFAKGFSGGPLLDSQGRVIGVMKASLTESNNDETGINVAISVAHATTVVDEIITSKKSTKTSLNVRAGD